MSDAANKLPAMTFRGLQALCQIRDALFTWSVGSMRSHIEILEYQNWTLFPQVPHSFYQIPYFNYSGETSVF